MVGLPETLAYAATRRGALRLLTSTLLASAVGCGMVPKEKMEESRRVNATLRADNTRLKDVALELQGRNQDLNDRAVDDARRLAVQEEALERLEKSVVAYQADRDAIERSFEAIKRQVRQSAGESVGALSDAQVTLPEPLTASPDSSFPPYESEGGIEGGSEPPRSGAKKPPTQSPLVAVDALKAFAQNHKGWSFDAATETLSVKPDDLFQPESNHPKPDAEAALNELASSLKAEGPGPFALEVAPTGLTHSVVAAGYTGEPEGDEAADARFLATSRAARVRERLAAASGFDAERVRLAAPSAADGEGSPRLLIRVAALDDGPKPGR